MPAILVIPDMPVFSFVVRILTIVPAMTILTVERIVGRQAEGYAGFRPVTWKVNFGPGFFSPAE
jgi:hypothetical protein